MAKPDERFDMTKATCNTPKCKTPVKSRGMCESHYRRALKTGLQLALDLNPMHRLSEVDTENATAKCEVCGPVEIRVRKGKSHECMTVRRSNRGRGSASSSRNSQLQRRYGITLADRDRMEAEQESRCAICDKHTEKLVVDHDHETGAVRELLCHPCNYALGFLRDSPTSAEAAADYLRRHAA